MIESVDKWRAYFLSSSVSLCAAPVSDHTSELTPAEHDCIATSIQLRKNTYATGRYCAKSALLDLGLTPASFSNGLLRADDGSVNWPVGYVGSITHTDDWAVAAVTKLDDQYASIGIDIEHIDRVGADVLRTIATDAERAFIESNLELRWSRVALFSIKESVYKCLRPIYGEFIRFKDVQLAGLDTPANFTEVASLGADSSAASSTGLSAGSSTEGVEFFSPSVELLLPKLAGCCDQKRISVRLAVLPSHVLSFVSYDA